MDNDKKLPDALGGQQLKGRRPLGRHLQQIQPCTCQSHCQRPERLRLRHTSCWVFVELVFLNELDSRVSSGLRWTFMGELAFIAPMAISVSNKITLFGHTNIFHRSAAARDKKSDPRMFLDFCQRVTKSCKHFLIWSCVTWRTFLFSSKAF